MTRKSIERTPMTKESNVQHAPDGTGFEQYFQSTLEAWKSLDDTALAEKFSDSKLAAVYRFMDMAIIVRIYDERGSDLGKLAMSHIQLDQLRRIGNHQMLPGLMALDRFKPTLVGKFGLLPIPDQHAIIEDRPIEVVTGDATRMIRPSELSDEQVAQVLCKGCFRTPAQQRTFIEQRAAKKVAPAEKAGPFTLDRRAKLLRVTQPTTFSAAKLLALAGQLME